MAANPNTLTADFPAYHSRRMQVMRAKETVFNEICSFEEKATLAKGTVVHRPYRSKLVVKTLGADGAFSRQALTDTDEYLTIDQEKEVSFYIREPDTIQSNYAIANEYSDDAMRALDEWTDAHALAEGANATSVVGNYEMGGGGSAADGIGITITPNNIATVFAKVRQKMKKYKISRVGRWAVVSEEFFDQLWLYIQGKDTAMGDKVGENPNEEGTWAGFRMMVSGSNYWTARLEVGTTATDGDTVVINGVTFTFETSTLDAAGKVKSETSAAVCIDNLVAAINNSEALAASTLGTAYYELTAANRLLMDGITAVDGTTYMTLKGYGVGYLVVSETLTAAADIWTTTKQVQHNIFGQGKPIDLVIQKYPSLTMVGRTGYVGKDFVAWMLSGYKTFKEGADAMVDVIMRMDAYTG